VGRLFGTDGVRGAVNSELTVELATELGRAAGHFFSREISSPRVIIARDTRESGPMLEAALSAGLMSSGVDVTTCGVLPSPAVAFLVKDMPASAGAVISASHNPASDNGIKFFAPDGFKLTEDEEDAVEALMSESRDSSLRIGQTHSEEAEERYVSHCLESLEGIRLEGLKVVLDCSNGAAFRTSPRGLSLAGADVIVINDSPDGKNINLGCGSTSPDVVAKAVVEHGAHVGLAHDGDADRLIAVDSTGGVIDGDAIIAALSIGMKQEGRLRNNVVVSTVMANLGFRLALRDAAIELVETPVGDRYVVEEMRRREAAIGGEQSGHIVFLDHATTGDGLITALRLLARMVSTDKSLSELASVVQHFPQVLRNVAVANRDRFDGSKAIADAVQSAKAKLGNDGRVLVRPSGTESVIRVMVEASDESTANEVAAELAAVVETELKEVV
jgi:phosphoglucosamine mutase